MNRTTGDSSRAHLCLLAFCVGVVALRFIAPLPPLALTVAALLVIVPAVRWRWWRPVCAFAVGLCWANLVATTVLQQTLPAALEKKDVVVTGVVTGVPVVRDGYQRFDLRVEKLIHQDEVHPSPGNIRLKLYRNQPSIRAGERWRLHARLKRARGYQNPGAPFNYETHLFHHRLRATGYVRDAVLLSPQNQTSVNAFRERAAEFIRTTLPSGGRAGVVTALSVGIRSDMRDADWTTLVNTGTIHLVAISGLHIGLVSGLVLLVAAFAWRFAGALPLWLPAPKVGVVAGVIAGVVYALLAGMTIPTQRAVCMLAVVAAAMLAGRRPFGGETWLLALAVVLAFDPLASLAAGFWLSFGAVIILIFCVTRARDGDGRDHLINLSPSSPSSPSTVTTTLAARVVKKLRQWTVIQVVLFIGMAPLLLALFARVSLAAPLANLIAVPVIGLVAVPLALTGLFLFALGLESAATLAFTASLTVIETLWTPMEWLANAHWSLWRQPSPPAWSLPLAAVGAVLLLAKRATPARWTGLLWMLPMFLFSSTAGNNLADGEFKYTMLEVGHGLASTVQTQNHLLLYDAGPKLKSGLDAGESIVAPFLHELNADSLDALVVSHGDNDHLGGYRAVLKKFPAKKIITGAVDAIPNAQRCVAGQSWVWDEVRFEMLWPPASSTVTGNDASCVLKISSRYGSLLLTGDIGKPAEAALAASNADLAADILQAPHHGSKTSSTAAFLSRVRPAAAVVSAGYLNRYGHPHRTVAARYARRGIPLYNTAAVGAIVVAFGGGDGDGVSGDDGDGGVSVGDGNGNGDDVDGVITIAGHRGSDRRYWLQPATQLTVPVTIRRDE